MKLRMAVVCTLSILSLLLLGAPQGVAAEPVTTGTVIDEMIDLDRLADMPADHYNTIQFSSYDRTSDVPGGPGWFNNADGFGSSPLPAYEKVLREADDEGIGEYLICDVEGAGCIVRTWTAAINGKIRVYLDGSDKPIFDGPAEQFLHRPYEAFVEGTEFEGESLRGTFYQRDAAYCPMPFAKRCRIVWEGNLRHVHFYYVQIRKYDDDVEVKTFTPEDLKTYSKNITNVKKVLGDPDANYKLEGDKKQPIDVTVEAGKRSVAFELEGPGALEQLRLKVAAENLDAALRQTIMHVSCDGWTAPQVQSPVGDFFGAAPGINPYVSLPFTVSGDGTMVSRFVMPYEKTIRVEFENLGDQTVKIEGEAQVNSRKWDKDRSMHFYARWRMMHDVTTYPPVDIPYLLANGAGRYVGTGTYMMNPARGTHPSGSWWGEGDEKIFIDDEDYPSSFGTGSEDYFNYAWSAVDIFFHPYCGQPRNDGPANRGFVTNNRWHIIDDLPFKKRISFYMELLSHHRVEGFSYGCIAYHYARPGKMDDHRVVTRHEATKPELPGPWKPLAYRGSANATYFEPEAITDAAHTVEEANLWTHGKLFVWKPKQKGDTLTLTLPVKEKGQYEVRLGMAHDARSGKVSAKLNGERFGFGGSRGILNTHEPHRTMIRASASDLVELEPGDYELELTYEGPGKEGDEPFVGIDFLWLQPR